MKDALNLPIDLPLSVVISSPEFLDASQERVDSIIGFNPDPTKHETFINMELASLKSNWTRRTIPRSFYFFTKIRTYQIKEDEARVLVFYC